MRTIETEKYKEVTAGWFDKMKSVDQHKGTDKPLASGPRPGQPQPAQQPQMGQPNVRPSTVGKDPLAQTAQELQQIFQAYLDRLRDDTRARMWVQDLQKKVLESINNRRMGTEYQTAYNQK